MTDPEGSPCPECGTPRKADNTPACPCGRRAADALLATRTAEAAAAEDFDPLRIRPYVDLEGNLSGNLTEETAGEPGGNAGAGAGADPGATDTVDADAGAAAPSAPDAASAAAPDVTSAPASAVVQGVGAGAGPGPGPGGEPTAELRPVGAAGTALAPLNADATADATMELRPVDGAPNTTLPTPPASAGTEPSAADLHLFAPGPDEPYDDSPTAEGTAPRRRHRRTVLLSVVSAAVATVAVAGFASGLFSYDTPTRNGAAPEDVRAGVPEPTTEPATTKTTTTPTAAPPAGATPSASASPSPTATPSPSATRSSPTPSATPSDSPEATRTATASPPVQGTPPAPGPVLRRGDHGAEVTELQLRLKQLNLYWGDTSGRFDKRVEDSVRNYQWARGISSDESGVYGPATRASLESETSQP
ncbi:peptidoglycan-binding protein [Streptomyces sp. NPDC006012]|uniref:peptidoglycan-binding domain-containing protein n=1 Tax=Streptomyces sp. NPDC006012 TaxID=3364739 RepID=UPI0036CA4D0C